MPAETRELYSSPNGDRWLLARDFATGNVFIRHEANIPSGGRVTEIDIGTFLNRGPRNPEHHALLQLIGTLLGTIPRALDADDEAVASARAESLAKTCPKPRENFPGRWHVLPIRRWRGVGWPA